MYDDEGINNDLTHKPMHSVLNAPPNTHYNFKKDDYKTYHLVSKYKKELPKKVMHSTLIP
jgi:hypothetical protein